MQNLVDSIGFVNAQAEFHERQASQHAQDAKRSARHQSTAAQFRGLSKYIAELGKIAEPSPSSKPLNAINLSWEELEGLPPELLRELSISESDRADYNIMTLIGQAGGVASLDRLLVSLYKQTGEITKRPALTARLYRMVQKDLVFPVPGKKGIYSLEKPASDHSDVEAPAETATLVWGDDDSSQDTYKPISELGRVFERHSKE